MATAPYFIWSCHAEWYWAVLSGGSVVVVIVLQWNHSRELYYASSVHLAEAFHSHAPYMKFFFGNRSAGILVTRQSKYETQVLIQLDPYQVPNTKGKDRQCMPILTLSVSEKNKCLSFLPFSGPPCHFCTFQEFCICDTVLSIDLF